MPFQITGIVNMRWVFVPGFSKHMVFYRYLSSEAVILIIQVLHGARNLDAILDEDEQRDLGAES